MLSESNTINVLKIGKFLLKFYFIFFLAICKIRLKIAISKVLKMKEDRYLKKICFNF